MSVENILSNSSLPKHTLSRRLSLVLLAISLLLVACGESQVNQCNRLIDVIDDGHALMQDFDKQTPRSTAQLSQDLDKLVEKLKAVKLSDQKLQSYRDRYAQIYSKLSDSFSTTSSALASAQQAPDNQSGIEQVQKAKKQVEKASQQAEKAAKRADAIAAEMNAYCHP